MIPRSAPGGFWRCSSFYEANKGGSDVFNRYIPHEEIASFVPIFGTLAVADTPAV
jgi:hypothetical protein